MKYDKIFSNQSKIDNFIAKHWLEAPYICSVLQLINNDGTYCDEKV